MSTNTTWICDKCHLDGGRFEICGIQTFRCAREGSQVTNVYLDLCYDCMMQMDKLITDFMAPKREYPKKNPNDLLDILNKKKKD